MIDLVKILSFKEWSEYEGLVQIELQEHRFLAAYTMLEDIASHIFHPNLQIACEIWLVFGTAERSPVESPVVQANTDSCSGFYRGRVAGIHNRHSFLLECGKFTFGVHNGKDDDFRCGDWVQIKAEMQIFPIHPRNLCTKELVFGQ